MTCRAQCKGKYFVDEEKKTDVNMAVEIMSDAINGNAKLLCVVSGDSDIQPAMEWVAQRDPSIKIVVYIPALPAEQSFRRLDYRIHNIKFECRFLPLGDLMKHQLPHNIKLEDKTFCCRPESWKIPG